MSAPKEPVIVRDSKEQKPFKFKGPTRVAGLKTCDYTIAGCEDMIGIERKSMGDLIACLGSQRARFERELLRAKEFEYAAVVVEGSYADLASGNYRSRFHPKSAIESISTFEVRYKIPFLFCGDRELAGRKCESLLRKF
ncbi:MAG: ERCC4 domain-containing protein [Pseudomonadota bacterium]